MSTSAAVIGQMLLFDGQGQHLHLEPEFARGGEGSVHRVRGAPHVVAKLYHQPVSPTKAAKLKLMVQMLTPAVARVSAWPTDVVCDAYGQVRGVLMPLVTGAIESHVVYSTKARLQRLPEADWLFLVRVARNTAAAVAALHAAGHVIGDLNQKGVLVARDATVRLIDCDSFQITRGHVQHLCTVGVAEFVPPELSGSAFSTTRRTANHDAFGLAVLLFHFLFLGRHPFVGVFGGATPSDMPVDRAIREFRFAYGADASAKQMRPPPGALPLQFASPLLASLFERSFSEAGATGARPTAVEWVQALDVVSAEIARCGNDLHHTYHPSLGSCPWCAMEAIGGVTHFVPALRPGAPARYDHVEMERLWRVLQVPTVAPEFPVQVPVGLKGKRLPMRVVLQRIAVKVFFLVGAIGFIPVMILGARQWPFAIGGAVLFFLGSRVDALDIRGKESSKRRAERALAQMAWDYAVGQWEQSRDVLWHEFDDARETMEDMLAHVRKVRDDRDYAEARLCLDYAMAREKVYLRTLRLEDVDLPQLSPALKQRLIAAGFVTAADIDDRICEVQGIGQARYEILTDWREQCQRYVLHKYDLSLPNEERLKLVKQWRTEELRRQQAVLESAAELRRAHAAFTDFVQRRDLGLEPVARRLGQARADVWVVG